VETNVGRKAEIQASSDRNFKPPIHYPTEIPLPGAGKKKLVST